MLNERGVLSYPGSNPGFSADYLSVAKLDKAPDFESGDVGVQVPPGRPFSALGIVAVHLAFNQVTGVRFSQGGPNYAGIAQSVEHDGATVEAVDSVSTARTNEREAVSRGAHNPAFAGSNPALSTKIVR